MPVSVCVIPFKGMSKFGLSGHFADARADLKAKHGAGFDDSAWTNLGPLGPGTQGRGSLSFVHRLRQLAIRQLF